MTLAGAGPAFAAAAFERQSIPAPVKAPATGPAKTTVLFDKIFIPRGFDSNDDVQIVGVGRFSHACYHIAQTDVVVDQQNHVIRLSPFAYKYNGFCLQVLLPFERVIDIGVVAPGTYQIVQSPNTQPLGQINVKASTKAEPDDYMYAPISQAFFDQDNGVSKVYLTGNFPNSCMHIKEVKTTVANDAIVVQPIIEMQDNGACGTTSVPFKEMVVINGIKPGQYLLHVRSMNGHAVNNLIDVQ